MQHSDTHAKKILTNWVQGLLSCALGLILFGLIPPGLVKTALTLSLIGFTIAIYVAIKARFDKMETQACLFLLMGLLVLAFKFELNDSMEKTPPQNKIHLDQGR